MELSTASVGYKNSAKNKSESPKTPKANSKGCRHENLSENKIYVNTPENCKLYYNIFAEESPQNYYDHCTLSQKMIIDEDRDVIWNWDNTNNKSVKTPSNKFLKELEPKPKSIFKKRQYQVKRKIKTNNIGEGLNKLQALQEEIIAKSLGNQKSDHTFLMSIKEENQYELNGNSFNNYCKILDIKSNTSLKTENSDFGNSTKKFKISKNESKFFYSEEDEILFQHSQIIENYNNQQVKSKDDTKTKIQNEQNETKKSFKDLTNVATLNKTGIKTILSINENQINKNLAVFECEESFDDIFLTIDLSSLNESNKKFQFQRHNSMPPSSSKSVSKPNRFVRHNSANNFNKENKGFGRSTAIPSVSDVADSLEFGQKIDKNISEHYLSNLPKRCSREEVEAKRLEAKRKRLLRIKKKSIN